MIPLFIPSHFGEHYQVLAWGQVSFPCGEVVSTTDAARLFSIITRELTIPAEQWRGVLMRLGISIPPNFFHTADIYHELVKLFQRRQLQLVKIPRLEQLPTIKAEEGWGYCFTQGPHLHRSLSYAPVAINSLQDAQAFLGQINIGENEISRLLPSIRINSTEHLAELLTTNSVMAYKIPVFTATPSVKPVEFLPATAADKPVPLGPESNSQTTTALTKKPADKEKALPPQSLEEASQRLIDAGPAVRAAKANNKPLPPSSYSLADKQAVVEQGLEEKFLVRVIETDYAGDNGYIGKVREHGQSISWTAPFSMVEHGDTDAEALLNAFGTRYDPAKKYTVLIIDRDKMNDIGDVQTIIPTKQNLKELIAENPHISTLSPDEVEQVLSDDHAPKYYAFAKAKSKEKISSADTDEMQDLSRKMGFSEDDTQLLIKRQKLADQVAAWEEFTGNGMTLDTNDTAKAYGPVEVVMLDKKPMKLGQLRKDNAVKSIDC